MKKYFPGEINGIRDFHLSCRVNNSDNVNKLIELGADVNSSVPFYCFDYAGYTPLHFAVAYDCEDIVRLLLEKNADCNKQDKEGKTPLHLASIFKDGYHSKITRILLDYNASLTITDCKKETPLHAAFYAMPDGNTVDSLISKIPRDVNFIAENGLSHFHIVCTRSDVSRVLDYLESGAVASVDQRVVFGKYYGYTPLHFAVLYNQKNVVEILFKWNAKVNVKKSSRQTPLHLACDYILHERRLLKKNEPNDLSPKLDYMSHRENNLEIIKLLLLHGADVDAKDSFKATPLEKACTANKQNIYSYHTNERIEEMKTRTKEVFKILLSNKANVNARNSDGQSVLHIISDEHFPNMPDLAEYVIRKHADIHAVDHEGLTPLHEAVKSSKIDLVQIFLKHKADVNAKCNDSRIPLQFAIHNCVMISSQPLGDYDKNILFTLLENDSDVNVIQEGNSLLQIAVSDLENTIVKKLLYHGADVNLGGSFDFSAAKAHIFLTIFEHVQKLLALGFHVNEEVENCFRKFYDTHQHHIPLSKNSTTLDEHLNKYYLRCENEINGMKLIKINSYVSLFNYMCIQNAHELSKHTNSTLIEILEDQNIDNEYPHYSYLLKLRYKSSLKRLKALNFAEESLSYIIKAELPDLCYDTVLKYLTNKDLANLNEAAKRNGKIKLNDDGAEVSQNFQCYKKNTEMQKE